MIEIPNIEGLTRDQILTLLRCRSLDQYTEALEAYRSGKCIFCDPLDPEKNRVIQQNESWRMWQNPYLYDHVRLHLIMATLRHIGPEDPMDIAALFVHAGQLFAWAQRTFGFTSGGFAMRFGSPEFNASSVLHLHAHIIVPDGSGEVRIALSQSPDHVQRQIVRMRAFEKMRTGTRPEDLDPEERVCAEISF